MKYILLFIVALTSISGFALDELPKVDVVTPIDESLTSDPYAPPRFIEPGKGLSPLQGRIISKFGDARPSGRFQGLDIQVPNGTLVRTIWGGKVASVSINPRYPNTWMVRVYDETRGFSTIYSLLAARPNVSIGQNVEAGSVIGKVERARDLVPQLMIHMRTDSGSYKNILDYIEHDSRDIL